MFCPKCGSDVDQQNSFCTVCGNPIDFEDQHSSASEKTQAGLHSINNVPSKIIIGVIIAAVSILLIFICSWSIYKGWKVRFMNRQHYPRQPVTPKWRTRSPHGDCHHFASPFCRIYIDKLAHLVTVTILPLSTEI
jgi:predicted nucleic acid-binding Zn ribbon protein